MISEVLSNPSQLVMRNSQALQSDRLLMVGMPADGLAGALLSEQVAAELAGLTRDFSVFRKQAQFWPSQEKHCLSFSTVLADNRQTLYDGVLVFLQKSKPLMDFWLDMILSVLAPDGRVWLVGENNEGIKSWRKRLKNHFEDAISLDSARHCGLLEATGPVKSAGQFNSTDYFKQYDVATSVGEIKVSSLPGVFSHGRLDKGTEVFLSTFDDLAGKKQVLDFGCGAGIIGAAVAAKLPDAELTLVDCDALAVESSKRTMTENGVNHYNVFASDGLSEVSGRFDLILSNPPFHQGVKTHYEVTEQFLAQSWRHLNKGGELRIVANSFLRYEPIISRTFGHCDILVTRNGFSVYRARRN